MNVIGAVIAGLVGTVVMTILAVHAIVAIVMMPIMIRMHPRPPEMEGGAMTMVGQLMGHLVYGLVVALVYAAI